jgi:hypothetical protein
MTGLLIGHDVNEDLRMRKSAGWYSQRLAWFAEDGDILVLPVALDEGWLEYVTGLTGTRCDTLSVVMPPGEGGQLTKYRLRDPEFLAQLRFVVDGRTIDRVHALWPDAWVVELAREFGAEHAVPGHRFLSQGGDAFVNSKAMFRLVASGIGLPVAEGAVATSVQNAEEEVLRLLNQGYPTMLKNEFLSGGWGNEIITRRGGLRRIGARRLIELEGRTSVHDYLAERWERLSGSGRHAVAIERYHPDSTGVFAEFSIEDDGVRYGGQGVFRMSPYGGVEIIPAFGVDPDRMDEVVSGGRRLCEALHAIGYRGVLSADAFVTPDGQVMFNEWNGRCTGSTHTYRIVGGKVVGPDYADDRIIVERLGSDPWQIGSFAEARRRLEESDVAYDPAVRRGVVLLHAFDPVTNSVAYAVIGEDMDVTDEIELRLGKLFGFTPRLA